jgi:hypothetical protein
MLGKIPPFILGPVGLVIIIGLTIAGYMLVVKPKNGELAKVQEQIAQQQAKAKERPQKEAERERVKQEWVTAHEGLAQRMDERSIPLSMGQPFVAMTNLWRETREDLPQLVEKFIRDSGCVLIQGALGWAPPTAPVDANAAWLRFSVGPSGATAGVGIPGGGGAPLWVAGSMADVERLYKSLRNFPRVITIHHMGLIRLRDLMDTRMYQQVRELVDRPDDEIVVAPIILTIWLMTETPEAGGAAAGAGAAAAPGAGPGPGAPAGGPPGAVPGPGPTPGPPGGGGGASPEAPPPA